MKSTTKESKTRQENGKWRGTVQWDSMTMEVMMDRIKADFASTQNSTHNNPSRATGHIALTESKIDLVRHFGV